MNSLHEFYLKSVQRFSEGLKLAIGLTWESISNIFPLFLFQMKCIPEDISH